MAQEIKLPDLGENIESGDVVNLLVAEGDEIRAGQSVVEIETDKATVEVPCPVAGKVTQILVKPGDTVPVGGTILTLESTGAAHSSAAAAPPNKSAESRAKAPEKSSSAQIEDQDVEDQDVEEADDEPTTPRGNGRPAQPQRKSAPADHAAVKRASSPPPTTPPSAPRRSGVTPPASSISEEEPQANLVPSLPAGPAVRRLARELGVDLHSVSGTGEDGRISREDVIRTVREATTAPANSNKPVKRRVQPVAAIEDQDNYGRIRRERMTKIRKTIATNMARSKTTIPHVTNFDDADITELDDIRRESISDYVGANIKLTMMPFVMKAVAHALKLHPMLNSSLDMDEEEIIYKDYVNLGIAVDTDRGLIVPVIRNIDQLGIPQIAQALQHTADKSRNNQFSLDDLRGGTFTISNLGAVGGTYSTPIINWPEVAVLLVGRSRKMPMVVDNEIKIRLMMPLSLSYDHRLVDGATAARFLNDVIAFLANPGRLLLAPVVG